MSLQRDQILKAAEDSMRRNKEVIVKRKIIQIKIKICWMKSSN